MLQCVAVCCSVCCSVLRNTHASTAACCSVLVQCVAVCNTLRHITTHCNRVHHTATEYINQGVLFREHTQGVARSGHNPTLQPDTTTRHYNPTLQPDTTTRHYNPTLQPAHCTTQPQSAREYAPESVPHKTYRGCPREWPQTNTATYCNVTLHHTARHCATLHHTASQCNIISTWECSSENMSRVSQGVAL